MQHRSYAALRPHLAILGALVLALTAVGCSTRSSPTPLPFRAGAPLDLAQAASDPTRDVSVLYATTRRPAGSNGYSQRRGVTTRLGVADVRFGKNGQSPQDIAEAFANNKRPGVKITDVREFGELWRSIPLSDPRFIELPDAPAGQRRTIDPDHELAQPEAAFVDEVNRRVAGGRRILLYVPGFNTSFESPIHIAAEFAQYLRGEAVPIVFSWPARSSPLGYSKQLTNAEASVRALRNLIELLIEDTDAEAIDVLAYSAGAPMVSDGLMQLRFKHNSLRGEDLHERLRIGTVIYAGADEDIDRFRAMYLDGFPDIAERITLYSSGRDTGLILSEFMVRGSKRLGRLAENLSEAERRLLGSLGSTTDVIDVSQAQGRAGGGDVFSHAYWFGNPWVSADVLARLRYGLAADERGLERRTVTRNGTPDPVWRFPRDYPDRVLRLYQQQDTMNRDAKNSADQTASR